MQSSVVTCSLQIYDTEGLVNVYKVVMSVNNGIEQCHHGGAVM